MSDMFLSEFDYILPKELIAQEGLKNRDDAKMMVLNPDGKFEHRSVKDLTELFGKNDLLVLNNTRVACAKLVGKKSTGGKIDLLIEPKPEENGHPNENVQDAYIRGPKIRPGVTLCFEREEESGKKILQAKVLEKIKGAKFKVEFDRPDLIPELAVIPLPPYIKKPLEESERYQTIFSSKIGSLAAPTAGLHFSKNLMNKLCDSGIQTAYLTLHIGIGTFAPIRTENIAEWQMQPEHYEITQETSEKINEAIKDKRRIFAVGTTSVRTLETVFSNGGVKAGGGWSNLFIFPGYRFKFPYSGMLTNFHLPKSSLLLLVCALAGKEKIFAAYAEAIKERYRFYSFGDTMLILCHSKLKKQI